MIALELSESAADKSENLAFHLTMLCERRGMHITFSYYEPVIRSFPH